MVFSGVSIESIESNVSSLPSKEKESKPINLSANVRTSLATKLLMPFCKLYVIWLKWRLRKAVLPQHVGLILDGNRRFAVSQGMQKSWMGHASGARKIEQVLSWLRSAGIRVVSIWIFSLDNFRRPPEEVAFLMKLFESELNRLAVNPDIKLYGVCVRAFGMLDKLPISLREAIKKAEDATRHHQNFFLNVGIAYSGQQEIIHTVQAWLKSEAQKSDAPSLTKLAENLSPKTLHQYLYNAKLPDPDLIIRTSGEQRTSGFLLWQSSYTEYYFCPVHWPALQQHHLLKALLVYAKRQRRFGV